VDDFNDLASQPSQAYYRLRRTPVQDFPLVGFTTLMGGTTGGQGGGTTTVSNVTQFTAAVTATGTGIVQVVGTITLGGNVAPRSHKTIVGLGTNATIVGDLNIRRATNVIVKNLHFTNPDGVGDGDGITVEESRNVWIDHCTFYDCDDGALDITHGSDLVTVSWCKFFYTFNSGHNFVNLVGHSDNNAAEDAGKLRVTFHHNWWSTLCVERMPRVRFGRVHVFNNYFNSPGNNYCVRASIESEVLVEHNFFENIDEPYEKFDPPGLIRVLNNITVNCTVVQNFNDTVFTPLYSYTPEAAASVPGVATNWAGAGKLGL
jgi:pectate lyase